MKPVFLLGEAPGANEVRIGAGFVGASGIELLRLLNEGKVIELTSADYDYLKRYYDTGDSAHVDMIWRLHPEVHRSNVFRTHPLGNDIATFCGPKAEGIPGFPSLVKSKYVRAEFRSHLEQLGDEIVSIDPHLILALGNTALWALCGTTGIGKCRGSTRVTTHTVTGYKVLPTYHPSAVLQQWSLRPVTVADFMKARREAQFPEVRRPKLEVWIEPTFADLLEFRDRYITTGSLLSVDIENPGGPIREVGWGTKDVALVIPFVDRKKKRYWNLADERRVVRLIKEVLEDPSVKKLFQNGLYDVAVIWRYWGIRTLGFDQDTMLLHHALQPESLKSLGFLSSVYTDHGAWKHLRKEQTWKGDD